MAPCSCFLSDVTQTHTNLMCQPVYRTALDFWAIVVVVVIHMDKCRIQVHPVCVQKTSFDAYVFLQVH